MHNYPVPKKKAFEKERVPAALCARVVRTSAGVPIDSPGSIISVAKRLQEQIPRAYILDQYNNPNTPAAYEFGTAGKIWRQTDGRVDVVITRAGTGGTVTRISRGLKRRSGGEVLCCGRGSGWVGVGTAREFE